MLAVAGLGMPRDGEEFAQFDERLPGGLGVGVRRAAVRLGSIVKIFDRPFLSGRGLLLSLFPVGLYETEFAKREVGVGQPIGALQFEEALGRREELLLGATHIPLLPICEAVP